MIRQGFDKPKRADIHRRLEELARECHANDPKETYFDNDYERSLFALGRELAQLDSPQNQNGMA